jgi:hypothetical protein
MPLWRQTLSSIGKGRGINEIVRISVSSHSAVSTSCEENFILAKNLSLHGRNQRPWTPASDEHAGEVDDQEGGGK